MGDRVRASGVVLNCTVLLSVFCRLEGPGFLPALITCTVQNFFPSDHFENAEGEVLRRRGWEGELVKLWKRRGFPGGENGIGRRQGGGEGVSWGQK